MRYSIQLEMFFAVSAKFVSAIVISHALLDQSSSNLKNVAKILSLNILNRNCNIPIRFGQQPAIPKLVAMVRSREQSGNSPDRSFMNKYLDLVKKS